MRAAPRARSPAATASSSAARSAALDASRLAEPDRELEVREPQLARGGRIEIGARLEIVGGDAELRREAAQRLHRRLAGPASMREM